MKNYIFYLIVTLAAVACSRKQSDLEQALQIAGLNRPELEKVLTHYKDDTLKYKAAVFLIENMPGHYSYSGDGIHEYYREIDSLLNTDLKAFDMIGESERITKKHPYLTFNTVDDIYVMKSDYLIRNIDDAFKLWKEKPWAEHLTFDQFCEYLLPYKCIELQEFDFWRDTLATKFSSGLENRLVFDQNYYSVHDAASVVSKDVEEKLKIIPVIFAFSGYHYLSASTMSRTPFGTCDISSDLLNCVMRAHGIPSMIDYVPIWGRRGGRHQFYTILDEKGNYLPALWGFTSELGTPFTFKSTTPKVLRRAYKYNKRILEYQQKTKYKGLQLSIFDIDVTDLYVKTDNLSIPVSTRGLIEKYAYISVFNNLQWDMIDFGELKGRKAHFSKIARDHIYLILGYNGSNLVPISDPFIIRTNGNIEYLTPDINRTNTIALKRKYPILNSIAIYENRIKGGKIQASNRSDFAELETFYVYDDTSFLDIINIENTKAYRYWRYQSPPGTHGNIAEVEFYLKGRDSIAKGVVIGTDGIEQKFWSVGREAAFDGDVLTFVDLATENTTWVGLDFYSPVLIDRVRCTPRSDDNYIRIGDTYELFYWINGDWQSLGVQVAKEKVLYYDSVPSNALLWLRNHTRGKEERIFTYENGKQRWW